MAVDHEGNLWITELSDLRSGNVAFVEVRRANILSLKNGDTATQRFIRPGGVGVIDFGWIGIGFDAADDLFASNGRELLQIPLNHLTKKRPSPTIIISSMSWFPGPLRFDSSDNLWVSTGNVQLWKFAPSDRTACGPPNPGLIVDAPNGFGIQDFAFDSSGNLWLAGAIFPNTGAVDEIEMISAADLVGSGEISPPASVTITSSAFGAESGLAGGICLGGLDFDHSGNLWVSTHCNPESHLIEFTPSQLSLGGNLTPSITISPNSKNTNIASPGPIRFGPALN